MKKLFSMVLALALFLTPAFGEGIDLSAMSLEELQSLREKVEAEIDDRTGEQPSGYSGLLIGGKSITKGSYVLQCLSDDFELKIWADEQSYTDDRNLLNLVLSHELYHKGDLVSIYFNEGTVAEISRGTVDIQPATEDWVPKE